MIHNTLFSNIYTVGYLICLIYCVLCVDLSNSQRSYNPSNDFLLHEGGQNPVTPPKRDYVAPQPTRPSTAVPNNGPPSQSDFNKDFPALGPPKRPNSQSTIGPTPSNTRATQATSSGKRDYVAPQRNTGQNQGTTAHSTSGPNFSSSTTPMRQTQSTGSRDYVAPQGNNNPPNTAGKPTSSPFSNTPSTQHTTSGRRDYVAPQGTTNRVKDLVSFYDNKGTSQMPGNSYSSVLSNNRPTSPVTQKPSTIFTTKPLSYSDAVGGSTKPSSNPTVVTQKPPNNNPPRPSSPGQFSNPTITPKPATPVLPSSLVNNNNNNKVGSNMNGITDSELETLSEELLRKDVNNAAKYITVNYQEKTSSQSKDDKAPAPLLTVAPAAWNIPTIQKFIPLLDNYEKDTSINEHVTPLERNEENAFMDAIMSTTVIRTLMNFFKEKGLVTPDPKQQRDFLKQMWFSLYARERGKIDSSGFEHVFVSEVKQGQVLGLHNWVYFAREEAANRANYLGYLKYETLNDKGAVIKLHMTVGGIDKPVNSIMVGTSPELEIALYTLCYVARVDNDCKLKLANKDVFMRVYNFRYRSKNLIGSAFPQI